MDRLDQYRIFAQIASSGSFIKASHLLNIPRASVSAAIQQLESQLGTRLLHRTTRQVKLTADGSLLLERIQPLLTDIDDIEHTFQTTQQTAYGKLHIDVPSRIARRLIAPALPGLFAQHPHLQLILSSTDRMIDLVQEGVDCAVRVGSLDESSLVARRLGTIALINCASPDYLKLHGTPHHPRELPGEHWAIGYASPKNGKELPWEYQSDDGKTHLIDIKSRLLVNNVENYIACCVAGLGLIQIPRFDVQQQLISGALVEVMPAFRPASMPAALVYPHRRQRNQRLAIFAAWFEDLIREYLDD